VCSKVLTKVSFSPAEDDPLQVKSDSKWYCVLRTCTVIRGVDRRECVPLAHEIFANDVDSPVDDARQRRRRIRNSFPPV